MIRAQESDQDKKWKDYLVQTYGWTFEDPWYREIPSIATAYREGREEDIIDLERDISSQLLLTYVMRDPLGTDHSARRVFRDQLEKENLPLANWVRDHNKLSRNRMAAIYQARSILVCTFGKQLKDLTLNITTSDFQKYDPLAFDDKIAFAKEFEKSLYTIFERLS